MEQDSLFPVIDVPDFIDEEEQEVLRYHGSVYWDIAQGDFKRDGMNRLQESSGKDAYIQWCHKVVHTERFAHMAYPDELGTEMDIALEQETEAEIEAMMKDTISEALLVNPRTESVRDFSFTWNGDSLYCQFTVKGEDLEEFTLKTSLTRKEVAEDDS